MDDGSVRITRLMRYPVKACAGEPLQVADLGTAGVRHDRVLAVTVGDEIVTQREFAQLARVQPGIDDDATRLRLRYDDLGDVESALDGDGPSRTVTIFGAPVEVVDQDAHLSAWFGEVLQRDATLVMAPRTTRRRSPGRSEGETVLSDEGTLSLHSQASLDALNTRLAAKGHRALGSERFRANIVVDGCPAHAEDGTIRFEVGERGEVVLGFAQVDERCVVTTVDQQAGRRDGPEPIRTLATYRRGPEGGGVRFGVYLAVEAAGRVRVGDGVVLHGS